MAGVAEFPYLLKSAILTHTVNNASIYAVRFYIRGKPWVIAVDDYLLMQNLYGKNKTVFAGPSKDKKSIWAAVFEKAWAKMKGNYLITESGYISEGIIALTGVPVFDYDK